MGRGSSLQPIGGLRQLRKLPWQVRGRAQAKTVLVHIKQTQRTYGWRNLRKMILRNYARKFT